VRSESARSRSAADGTEPSRTERIRAENRAR
jgi:hypothetical protein